jgi:hypothetical protein
MDKSLKSRKPKLFPPKPHSSCDSPGTPNLNFLEKNKSNTYPTLRITTYLKVAKHYSIWAFSTNVIIHKD